MSNVAPLGLVAPLEASVLRCGRPCRMAMSAVMLAPDSLATTLSVPIVGQQVEQVATAVKTLKNMQDISTKREK